MRQKIRILTWNINFSSAESIKAIRKFNADIVMLQEIKRGIADEIVAALQRIGLEHHCYSGLDSDQSKRYGNITASRWPVSSVERGWAPGMPWPQLALRATVHTQWGDIDVINVHIPNGSYNGWKKVDSLEALAKVLIRSDHGACIVGGDFNEPKHIIPLVSWGQLIGRDGSVRLGRRNSGGAGEGRYRDRSGCEHDLKLWDTAVRRIFEGANLHGLRHVRELVAPASMEVTSTWRNRFYDHLFVSRHFSPTHFRCAKNPKLSDHSAVYADVEMETETFSSRVKKTHAK